MSTGEPYDTERILTLPNVLSFVRLLGVPLFLWLLLARQYDLLAVAALAFLGATDCRPSLTMAPAILTGTKRRLARAKVSCTAA